MEFYASGKLLLFGEYLVLKGADCLAIPLSYGQTLNVEKNPDSCLIWLAKVKNQSWFSLKLSLDFNIIETSDFTKAQILIHMFTFLKSRKPHLFKHGLHFYTQTDFPLEWGFGTSSSLISLLTQWSGVDPFLLLQHSFGGSGYDIACATERGPILFNIQTKAPISVHLHSDVTSKLLFVYSGKKQNSAGEIKKFNQLEVSTNQIHSMNQIVSKAIQSETIEEFEQEMENSESLLSFILQVPSIKNTCFSSYPYFLKSLGAWGGDFFMATFRNELAARNYFKDLGYSTQFNYSELIK